MVGPRWDQGGSTALVDTNICLFLPPVSLTWVPPLQSLSPTSAALFSANFLHPTIFLAPAAHPGHIVVLQLCRAILYCTYCISPAQLHVQLAKEDKALWFLLSFALKFLSLCAAVQVLRAPIIDKWWESSLSQLHQRIEPHCDHCVELHKRWTILSFSIATASEQSRDQLAGCIIHTLYNNYRVDVVKQYQNVVSR